MNHRLLPTLLLVAAACAVGAAHAEKADRAKPMNIEADALRHDELKQTSVFSGRVVMTKGTIVLRGARLDVRQDADGYQYGVVTAEPGKRAFFRQKRDTAPGAPDEFIEGESEVIEYDGKADNVRFITRAELRRYRGSVLSDEITGAVIVYNNTTDVFTVDGQRASSTSAAGAATPAPGGRVRAVLSPKDPPPNAAAAPAAPAASAPALRPSNSLGGGSR
ncbi:lipopolysaccharide transport periplasmic protein LptA [Paracidovorax sp. MALMAid1276]|uniref:lipopolysaccharide transport periplasmic protein LptA n=1 Tax=Paracidovorax sp. MALMAid1276 TaxID=3411631 RepID=UPI003B9999C6